MQTYHIPEPVKTTAATTALQKILRFLFVATVNSVGFFALDRLWNFFRPFRSANDALAVALIFGIGMGLMIPWSDRRLVGRLRKASYPYEIAVNDEEMTGISPKYRRTIRKGHARAISERKSGILVSERGPVGLFLWGRLSIPKTLPEYDHLRALVESWRVTP